MKTAIIYYSKHHCNTKKLLDAISENYDITLINALNAESENINEYDIIGFASGIYYSKFHKLLIKLVENKLGENKKVFFIYTYGAKKDGYTKAIKEAAEKKSAQILGEYGCFGFNTFGPFKLIGGIAKGHPNEKELKEANEFYSDILKKA